MAVHMIAKWRDGTYSEYRKLDAQQIYDEIRSIGSSNGSTFESVSNAEFVEYARRNPNSESYKIFEWNDAIAAESFRKEQARVVKNSLITFEIKNPQVELIENEQKKPIPLFLNPSSNRLKQHAPTEIVMMEPDLRKSVLKKALDELNAFKLKYHYLKELSKVFDAISQVNIP